VLLRRSLLLAAVTVGLAPTLGAQSAATAPAVLTLDEALAIAKRNNPTYQLALNGQSRAAANRRAAYGALIPSLNSNFNVNYREGIQQFFAGVAFGAANNTVGSSYGLNANLTISPGLGFGLRSANADYSAADASVNLGLMQLRRDVTVQFMNALQARARVSLQDTLLASARTQLTLTEARAKAGLATDLDVRRSQVSVGQQEVALLQARSQAEVEVFRLFQQLGVTPEGDVRLSGDLPITAPPTDLKALQANATQMSPELRNRRAQLTSAQQTYRAQQTQYLPTLNLGANVSGATQRLLGTLPPNAPTGGQGSFPFDFVRQPYTLSAGLSLPIFNGFQREQQIQAASAGRREAEAQLRQSELAVQTTVVSQATILQADYKAVEINRANLAAAREALTLAEERYRLGLANLVDLVQVRADLERASNDYINSVYTFHRDLAQLEAVTGPLR
jgi:outer membrane protein